MHSAETAFKACPHATRVCASAIQLSPGSDETPGRHLTYQRANFSQLIKVSALIALKTCFLVGDAVLAGHSERSPGAAVQTLDYQPLPAGKGKRMIGDLLGFGAEKLHMYEVFNPDQLPHQGFLTSSGCASSHE